MIVRKSKFMREQVTINIFKSNRVELGLNKGDKRVIVRPEPSKKKRERFMVREWLINCSKGVYKMGEAVKIICDG